jgi:predicted dehydrogenase
MSPDPAKIAVIGAGWWSQGWHLPHLHRHEQVHLVAIVDPCEHPQSNIAPLHSLEHLAQEYQVQVFSSVAELLEAIPDLDGVVIATPHATHF